MSTDYPSVPPQTSADKTISLTQYCGSQLHPDDGSRLRMQLTAGEHYVSVSKKQAAFLIKELALWVADENSGSPVKNIRTFANTLFIGAFKKSALVAKLEDVGDMGAIKVIRDNYDNMADRAGGYGDDVFALSRLRWAAHYNPDLMDPKKTRPYVVLNLGEEIVAACDALIRRPGERFMLRDSYDDKSVTQMERIRANRLATLHEVAIRSSGAEKSNLERTVLSALLNTAMEEGWLPKKNPQKPQDDARLNEAIGAVKYSDPAGWHYMDRVTGRRYTGDNRASLAKLLISEGVL